MPALMAAAFSAGGDAVLTNRMHFEHASVWVSNKGVGASEGERDRK